MPESSTVSAGDDVLAAQYNDLRKDVLDASLGHRHTGGADEGRLIPETGLETAVRDQLGQNIGLVAKVSASTTSSSFVDALNYTGAGRLKSISCGTGGGTGEVKLIIDGVDHGVISIPSVVEIVIDPDPTGNAFTTLSTVDENGEPLDILFKTSLQIQYRNTGGGAFPIKILYEHE